METITLEYLRELAGKALSDDLAPTSKPCSVESTKCIDRYIGSGLMSVDEENRVWCGSMRVYEDVRYGSSRKYNNLG